MIVINIEKEMTPKAAESNIFVSADLHSDKDIIGGDQKVVLSMFYFKKSFVFD